MLLILGLYFGLAIGFILVPAFDLLQIAILWCVWSRQPRTSQDALTLLIGRANQMRLRESSCYLNMDYNCCTIASLLG